MTVLDPELTISVSIRIKLLFLLYLENHSNIQILRYGNEFFRVYYFVWESSSVYVKDSISLSLPFS